MPRAALLVLSLLLLLPLTAGARRYSPARWDISEPIIVENRMGPEWNHAVEFAVRGWKQAFPRFKFNVIHRPNRPCGWRFGRIVVCGMRPTPERIGIGLTDVLGHQIRAAQVKVAHTPGGELWDDYVSLFDLAVLCHEFGHVLGVHHTVAPNESCMHNPPSRTMPGVYDQNTLKLLYRKRWK